MWRRAKYGALHRDVCSSREGTALVVQLRSMQLRPYLRQLPGWVTVRRLRHEGWAPAFHRWRLWSQILDTRPTETEPIRPAAAVEIHLLCHELDHLCALWALKTFYHFSAVRYPLVIHLNGST